MPIRDSRHEWPFPAITNARREGSPDWVEISEDRRLAANMARQAAGVMA